VVTVLSILALQPLGLTAAAAGLSIGAFVGVIYALRLLNSEVGVPLRPMLHAIWPAILAAAIAALGVLAFESFVVDAESHGTALGLLLLGGEALVGVVAYLAVLEILDPAMVSSLFEGTRSAWRRIVQRRGADLIGPDLEVGPESLDP
jgi:hypothetical protein